VPLLRRCLKLQQPQAKPDRSPSMHRWAGDLFDDINLGTKAESSIE
jgi:hypothetical protein